MTDIYVKGTPLHEFQFGFDQWEWGNYENPDPFILALHQRTAEFVASEILNNMEVYIETDGTSFGDAIVTTDALDDAFVSFDLAAVVAGSVEAIETDYPEHVRDDYKNLIRLRLLALRAKLVELVEIVDAAPTLKEGKDDGKT